MKRLLLLFAAACGSTAPPVQPGGDGSYVRAPYQTLAEYGVVELKDGQIVPRDGVVPYDLNTPLFSDGAVKARAVYLPKGTAAQYDDQNAFAFPTGALLIKSFAFPDGAGLKWIETRLLIRADDGWHAAVYRWNDQQTAATYLPGGQVLDIGSAHYLVPSVTQCQQCHAVNGAVTPIGPKARNLNRDLDGENQLTHWASLGILTGVPANPPKLAAWNDTSLPIEQRARAYLEVNCAHCHSETGFARNTGLYLWSTVQDPGVCKIPVAAGPASGPDKYDVVPGQPDASVLAYRLNATDPGIAMPPLGRSVVDQAGLQLVRQWISGLTGSCPP